MLIRESLVMNFSIKGESRQLNGDAALTLTRQGHNFPFIICEVAVWETKEHLEKMARLYANGSHGKLTLLFCINVEEKDREAHSRLQRKDISLTVNVWRISRQQKRDSNRYKVRMDPVYDKTRDMSDQSTLDFPGFVKVLKSDIWARYGSLPEPIDSIEVSMTSFFEKAKIVIRENVEALNSNNSSSSASEHSELSSNNSNPSVAEDEDLESDQDDELADPSWEPK